MYTYESGLASKVELNAHQLEVIEFFIPAEEIEDVVVLRKDVDGYGIQKYLLEHNGFRGWLEDGISYADINWSEEWVDGWSESVSLDGEAISQRI